MRDFDSERSPEGTPDKDETPHPFEGGTTVRRNTQESRYSTGGASLHHEPLLFSSSRRVISEVEKACKDDATPSRQIKGKFWREFWAFIRPDFVLDHLDYKSLKIVSRTWVALFFSILMLVITRFNQYIGVTAFLGLILSSIEVAGGTSYSHAFYTSVADLVFILFGFTCTTIGHAISWRIRGYPTVSGLLNDLSVDGVCSPSDTSCLFHEIHDGRYLSTKTTVIMLFAIFFCLFITGYLSQKTRMVLIPQILASITVVITGTYLNMTPQFDPWLYGRVLVLPFGLALSMRFVLNLFWFPVSSNYKFFSVIHESIVSATKIMSNNIGQLESLKPSGDEFASSVGPLSDQIEGSLKKFALLELEGLLCRGEINYSRFDPGDLGEFRALVRKLVGSLIGYSFFFDEILERRNMIIGHEKSTSLSDESAKEEKSEAYRHAGLPLPKMRPRMPSELVPIERRNTLSRIDRGHRKNKWLDSQLTHVYAPAGHFEDDRYDALLKGQGTDIKLEDLDEVYPQIIEHYKEISDAILELLNAIIAWTTSANKFRTFEMLYPPWRKKHEKLQAENAARVCDALDALADADAEKDKGFSKWAKTYRANHIGRSTQYYINILSIDSFHGCTMRRMAWASTRLAKYCIFLDQNQPKPRLIYPFMRLRSKSPRFETEYLLSEIAGSDAAEQTFMRYEPESHVQRRNPDSTPPRNYYHLLGRQVMKLFGFLRDAQVKFAIKRGIFTLMAIIPYCTRTTIMFSYSYRLVWAAIMVALTIAFQALDGIYGFFSKLSFTLLGCVIGMVVWYIGAGSGRGNPYGIGAALSVVMLFLAFFRHFNNHTVPMASIILCVTVTIVTGTSWADSKLDPLDVKLHWGFRTAWIRFVCVISGLLIAFIGTILPKPVTAKKNIRVMLSGCLEQLGEIQTSLCNFAMQRSRDGKVHIAPRQDSNRVQLRRVAVTVNAAKQLANRLNYEPPLGGLWPKHRYLLLLKLTGQITHILGSVHYLVDNIEDPSRIPPIIDLMGWSDVELMSSMYSVLVLGGRSLAMAKPLPSVTPGHLSEIYSHILGNRIERDLQGELSEPENLFENRYVDHDGRITLALIILMHMMFTRIDACVRIIKGLVGEIYGVDLEVFNIDPENGLGKLDSAVSEGEQH